MLPKKNPTLTKAWKALEAHRNELSNTRIAELFENDPERFRKFSFTRDKILVDLSKNLVSEKTLQLLLDLANEVDLNQAIKAMFTGEAINETENRAVLHTALRLGTNKKISVKGKDVVPEVHQVLEKIEAFSEKITKGEWKGFSGKPIKDIINIGIGGSDLGPAMVCEALASYKVAQIDTHFVSNVDGTHLIEALKKVDPETTLFIISSKTFTTQETMTNAYSAREWFLNYADDADIKKHFVAVSTNSKSVKEFGIDPENMFEFWDWVGGRYSVWSAIGLPIACSIGFRNFRSFLDGANSIDEHFSNTPFDKNIPVLLALISIWYVNFFNAETESILPYNQYLDKLVDYLQQVTMESNGKKVDRNGERVSYQTCPIIWGAPGTNGQHSFYQLIHQGTRFIPCDFIAAANSQNPLGDHHDKLLSNFLGQTNALMHGKSMDEVVKEMKSMGKDEKYIKQVAPFRVFDGNKPTNTILLDELSPFTLGNLLAIYEHKVFVQGVIWNIFSFDQWGVELGKQIAGKVLESLSSDHMEGFDPSTKGLFAALNKMKKGQ